MTILLVILFCLCIFFPSLHLLHCLPWFRDQDEGKRTRLEKKKGISILVPCYNEQDIVETSINSMKSLSYSEFEVIYVNDGSTDQTLSSLHQLLDLQPYSTSPLKKLSHKKVNSLYRSKLYPHIFVLDKENGGKADALNAGIEFSNKDLIVTLDADTILTDEALSVVNDTFEDKDIVAAGGMVHVLQTKTSKPLHYLSLLRTNMLVRVQTLDFLKAFYINKVSLARFRSLAVISGAFGIFRKEALLNAGGYRKTIGEDIDITLSIHRYISKQKNKKIIFLPEAVGYTELPETWKDLFKQRVRWQKAFIDCLFHFRSFFGKTLISKAVSFFYVVESFLAGTMAAYITSFIVIINAVINPPSSYAFFILFYASYIFFFSLAYNLMAVRMGKYYGFTFYKKEKIYLLLTIFFDIFVYRFVTMYFVLYGSVAYFFNKDWNKVDRTGRNYQDNIGPAA
ncbi:glycosyltransferase [Alteribacillus sp. JSM 102045]|uniref:glycosyltransferase family 2 protein n=1 Tax=Alteribacillus sp. JSM 102045 TaxID=1562101 RepID=UPI0035C0557D